MFSIKTLHPNRLLVRGIIAVLVGITAVAVPDLSIQMVMQVLGALLIADGLVALLIRYMNKNKRKPEGMLSVIPRGSTNLIIGVILLAFPTLLVNAFVFVIGLILLLAGVSQFSNQISGRSLMGFSWLLTVISVVAIVSGVILLAKPFESAQAILIFFGIIISIYGIGEIVWSFKLRKYQAKQKKHADTVDADFTEIE